MELNKKNRIDKEMEDVIKTSKKMRDYLLNDKIDFEERVSKLKVYNTALNANRNIVSASSIQVSIEKFDS